MEEVKLTHESESVPYPETLTLSEQIGRLLAALADVQKVYSTSNERVQHMDRLTQDLLHALELQDNTYHERARIATELQQCRAQRRPYKDNIYRTEPIAGFLRSDKGEKFIRQLEYLRGLAQHAERTPLGRKYSPRVLTPREYEELGKKPIKKQNAQHVNMETPTPPEEEIS